MKAKFLGAMTLTLLIILAFALVAQAAVAQSGSDAIIKDAQDGTIDGTWTAAQIREALAYIQNNPIYEQYSDLGGVLQDYLASLAAPGEQGGPGGPLGQLAFTGSEVLLILGAGAGLIGSGALLRRRRA